MKKALNPQAPVAQKVGDQVVFLRFRGEGVEFFQIGPGSPPPQIFDARLLKNTNLNPSELKTLKKFCFDQEVRKKWSISN